MTFGEKLQKLRKEKGITQTQLSQVVDVSLRTIIGWETGARYPRKREVYQQLADFFDVDVNYLLVENEITDPVELYGDQALVQARAILEQAKTHFAGDLLTPQEKLRFLQDIQGIFLDGNGVV